MSSEGSPIVPVVTPAPPAAVVPPVSAPLPVAAGSPPPAPPEPGAESAPPPAQDWKDKRIATLTAKLAEERARNSTVVPVPAPGVVQPPAPIAPAPGTLVVGSPEFNAAIDEAARVRAQVNQFNAECDAVALAGRTQYGEKEFTDRVKALLQHVDRTDMNSLQAYNSFLMAALRTGEAPRLMFELGNDMNEAQRILAMSPIEMAVELTKRSARAPVAPLSGAPAPITPVGNRGGQHTPIDPSDPARAKNLPVNDWMARREAQVKERNERRMGSR